MVYDEWVSISDWLGVPEYSVRKRQNRLNNEAKITDKQNEIITGLLLGDGYLSKISKECKKANSYLATSHTTPQKGYIEWINQEFNNISCGINIKKEKTRSIRGKPVYNNNLTFVVKTITHSKLTKLESKWYKRDDSGNYVYRIVGNGKKIE